MKKTIHDNGKESWVGVELTDKFDISMFFDLNYSDDLQKVLHTNLGSITILDRMTGYSGNGIRDTETGFRDIDGNFWLASCDFDVRTFNPETIGDAISIIKKGANTYVPSLGDKS